ncbi:MAG: hypothetical protein CVU05_06080 [Bacteroidetes bacterium HGW-Bacteroidetes-21]|jgi:Zn ribbon nucleic-acid-binding protein|nr:MAG: hypothetical protein CVU05_06080 [Bacteroidetes bacterium HGW-Bacteroidetes-21]
MKTFTGLFVFTFFLAGCLLSQDTLTMLDGKTITGSIVQKNDTGIIITTQGFFAKKQKRIYNDEVFSIHNAIEETIIYKQDTADINSFNVGQMSYFIQGMNDGRKNYHSPLSTIGGFVSGATGGIFGFWGLAIPSTYVFIAGAKTPKYKIKVTYNEDSDIIATTHKNSTGYGFAYNAKVPNELKKDVSYYDCYKNGYQEAAKDKKIKNAIYGSVIGVISFIAGSYLIVRM